MVWMVNSLINVTERIKAHQQQALLYTKVPSVLRQGDFVFVCVSWRRLYVPLGFRVEDVVVGQPGVIWKEHCKELAMDRGDYEWCTCGCSEVFCVTFDYLLYREHPWLLTDFGLNRVPRGFCLVKKLPAGLEDWGVKK